MPTYDYQCRSCGHTVEVIHGMTEDGPAACELCDGPLRRVIFPTGIIFKGSGFYRNDARSGAGGTSGEKRPAKGEGSATTPSATDGGSGGSTSTDGAKPATPTSTSD